jgi:hypothetical protein
LELLLKAVTKSAMAILCAGALGENVFKICSITITSNYFAELKMFHEDVDAINLPKQSDGPSYNDAKTFRLHVFKSLLRFIRKLALKSDAKLVRSLAEKLKIKIKN